MEDGYDDGSPEGPCEFEAVDLDERLVILPDGRAFPIVSMWDVEGDEVEDVSDAHIILAGTPIFGWLEIELESLGDAPTIH